MHGQRVQLRGEAAHAWWLLHDRPRPERFGLTVTTTGEAVRLVAAERAVPLAG
ncbi:hypothetical protein KV205_28590 [Streptomyces sp. SKN60]|uniref:hypothetical protein n=1 Tax=Streptomyces sp. SKN60 TaxID=2855506 RepID=UPI0022480B0D|nr:hypothetical protein [Streptomyces sp. SKN60]MCX2184459.1 hypothetical protein [Streptomyces sp. SKN60]